MSIDCEHCRSKSGDWLRVLPERPPLRLPSRGACARLPCESLLRLRVLCEPLFCVRPSCEVVLPCVCPAGLGRRAGEAAWPLRAPPVLLAGRGVRGLCGFAVVSDAVSFHTLGCLGFLGFLGLMPSLDAGTGVAGSKPLTVWRGSIWLI
ncbi:MAG: hypothetical protein IE936_09300, partial [Moraxella osloensis]|nr:hypothetical protein [Moraxella osloensis]